MKQILYSGLFVVRTGDILVYCDGGRSVITKRELRSREVSAIKVPWVRRQINYKWNKNELLEEQKMKNYFVLDGKQISMSDETADSLRKERKSKVPPMVRKARLFGGDRIVLRLSDQMKMAIVNNLHNSVFGFNSKGNLCGSGSDNLGCYDSHIETLFEGDVK